MFYWDDKGIGRLLPRGGGANLHVAVVTIVTLRECKQRRVLRPPRCGRLGMHQVEYECVFMRARPCMVVHISPDHAVNTPMFAARRACANASRVARELAPWGVLSPRQVATAAEQPDVARARAREAVFEAAVFRKAFSFSSL